MSLYQCDHCGCCENTALGATGHPGKSEYFDWTGIEELRDMQLCSACGPLKYSDGAPTKYGKWHGRFPRTFLPKGKFITNKVGNLAHKETGDEDFRKWALKGE